MIVSLLVGPWLCLTTPRSPGLKMPRIPASALLLDSSSHTIKRVHLAGPGAPCKVLVFPRWLRGEVGGTPCFFLLFLLFLVLGLYPLDFLDLVLVVVLTDEHQSSVPVAEDMVSKSSSVSPG